MYERSGMSVHANAVKCGMVEWVRKYNEWSGYVEWMGSGEFMKKACRNKSEGPNTRGRPLERWRDRVEKYMGKRGIRGRGMTEQAGWDRERWRLLLWPPL